MPLVVIDARGLTFRASGARTRLVELLRAYAAVPDRFEVRVIATAGRSAREHLGELDVDLVEVPNRRADALRSTVRLGGEAFRGADLIQRETLPIPITRPSPVLLTIHDLRGTEDRRLASSTGKLLYERFLLPHAASQLTRIIAVSEATAMQVRRHLHVEPEQVVVVPNGVAKPQDSSYGPRPVRDHYVLALGHIERRKNLPAALPAMQLLAREAGMPKALVVAGRDLGGLVDLNTAYAQLGAPAFRLDVRLDVSDAERAALLAHAACVVAPSLTEGFGLVPLEALAHGTPSVIADIPAAREALGTAALFVDPRDSRSLADALRDAVRDPSVALSHAPEILERRSWNRSAQILHECWRACL